MKKILLLSLSLSLLTPLIYSQIQERESIYKYDSKINSYELIDNQNPPPGYPVLFIGSSSFTLWDDIEEMLPGFPIINRGFGGSTLHDQILYFNRVVLPYHPKQVIIYCGENDIARGKTPDEVKMDFIELFRLIRSHFPDTRVLYVSMKPSPSRWKLIKEFREGNKMIKEFLSTQTGTAFLDVEPLMTDKATNYPLSDIFLSDSLHLNSKGYERWAEALKPLLDDRAKRILKVPSEYKTIAEAVKSSGHGDHIIIAPGLYKESEIEINKSITISSEWKFTGDESRIQETIIDAEDKILFSIRANGVEISGLKIINGNHTLDISSRTTVIYNHFVNNLDAISFESGGGGYVAWNLVENDRDDGIDLDIVLTKKSYGSNILIENNIIHNSNDDGIEIRLYSHPEQNIKYTIRENVISGSNNAAIQIISYDVFTGKEFHIHHNILTKCKTGLGCMEGANTREDLTGASQMDEKVYFYNNTIVGNKMGATGGNQIVAMNNIVMENELGGFKRFGKNSAIVNNLFFANGGDDFFEVNQNVIKKGNITGKDPLINKNTFTLLRNSICIDAGAEKYESDGNVLLRIPPQYITGSAPDLGAIEWGK